MSGVTFEPLHEMKKPKCQLCSGRIVVDYTNATSTCVKCGVTKNIIVANNCVTFGDMDRYNVSGSDSLRRSGYSTTMGSIVCRPSAKTSNSKKRYHQNDNDKQSADNIKCIRSTVDRITQTRSTRRYNNIRTVIEELRDVLTLTDHEIDRVFDLFDRMKPEHYPRSVELHTRVLITIISMKNSGRSLKDLCRGSKSVAVKDLAGCLKTVCKHMQIPVSNPSVVIATSKYSTPLCMTRYQTARSERIVKYLLCKCPSLHPATHISTALLISKVHGRQPCELTPGLIKRVAEIVETTVSTLTSSYEMITTKFPETMDTSNKLKLK